MLTRRPVHPGPAFAEAGASTTVPAPRPRPHDPTVVLVRTSAGTVVMPRLAAPAPAGPRPGDRIDDEPVRRIALWKQLVMFAVPASVVLVLGRAGLGARQMWNDEHATWHAASLTWGELFRLLDHIDRVLTLYYVLMHGWLRLTGDTPAMLRLPSVVAMACAAGFTAMLGQRLFNSPAGLVAGLAFAVMPAASRYAQEARPYAFAVAAATLATLLLVVALDRPRWPYWLMYAAAAVLTAFFHLVAVLVLVAHVVLLWFRYKKSDRDVRLWKSVGAFALIAAFVMPLGRAGSSQTSAIGWIKADRVAVLELPVRLFGSYQLAAVFAGMALVAVAALPWVRRRRVSVTLLVWALAPPVITFVTFPLLHLFLYRYLLFTLPAWALLAAGGCYGLAGLVSRRAWPQVLIALLTLPALAVLALPAHQAARQPVVMGEPDYRAAARVITAGLRPDDGIVFAGGARPPRLGMSYELRTGPRPADVLVVATEAELGSYGARECPVTATCLRGRQRVWLVNTSYGTDPWSEMPREKAAALSRVFTVTQAAHFQRVHVYLLVRNPGAGP